MKRVYYMTGVGFGLLCGLIAWWWHGVYREEQDRLLLEATSRFQGWKSDAISATMTELLSLDGLPGRRLTEGAAPDTVIHLDFIASGEEALLGADSLSIRIDVSSDSQAEVTERVISQSSTARLLTERLSEFNERESGAIRMVLLRMDQDSASSPDRLLLSDTLAGGTFLGKTEFRIGYENYRGFVFQRMLPEIFLGCRSGPSPAHRLVHRGRSGAAGRSVANLRSGRTRRNAAGRGRLYDR